MSEHCFNSSCFLVTCCSLVASWKSTKSYRLGCPLTAHFLDFSP